MKPAEELLYDSEASLRLVDHAIAELSGSDLDSETSGLLARVMLGSEQLDGESTLSDAERHQMANTLRQQLDDIVNHLQLQDITGRQLEHLSNLLGDLNRRIAKGMTPRSTAASSPGAADPDGQAFDGEIFGVPGTRKTA
jgi:hypothetical protein